MKEAQVCEIRYVGLAVVDLAAEREFMRERWGLREVSADDSLVHLAAEGSDEPFVYRLRRAQEARLDLIGMAAPSRPAVDILYESLLAQQAKIIHRPRALSSPGGGYGFRVFDPNGLALEISCDVSRGPSRPLEKGESIPVRLSHVVLHAPDVPGAVAFYEQLGFRVSDWLAQFMCFLRCNSAHHRLAIMIGPANLNHVAFEMLSVDEMMRGIGRLAKAGVSLDWGPGRHTAGDNTFAYFRTPAGATVEYTAELEHVVEATWRPKTYPFAPEITDQWGTGRVFIAHPPHFPKQPDPGVWAAPPV